MIHVARLRWLLMALGLPLMLVVCEPTEPIVDPALAIRGKRVANRCVACHDMDSRSNKIGPHLVGLMGRDVASVRGFDYSQALRGLPGEWTPESLRAFLLDPQAVAPGTNMVASSLNAVELEGLLVYLASLQ